MISIRRATAGDLPALERLWKALQDTQGHLRVLRVTRDPDEEFRARVNRTLDVEGHAWLVAERDGSIVAMAYLHPDTPSRISDEPVLEISRVCVAQEARGLGIGKMLVEEAERHARAQGIRFLSARVFSGNREAMAFWEHLGFDSFVDTRLRRIDG